MSTESTDAALGAAALDAVELDATVSRLIGRPVTVVEWDVTPIDVDAITTEAVLHLHGTARDGAGRQTSWDLLVKIVRSPRHWPALNRVPEAVRQTFIDYPWRCEMDLRAAGAGELLPDGLRLPELYRSVDLGDDRLALWTEWIDATPDGWDLGRYRRAATLLGRMTARWRMLPGVDAAGRPTQLRDLVNGPIMTFVVPRLSDPRLVGHPLFADLDTGPLFDDLTILAGRLPALLDHLETRPRSIGHGDACPQNLLVARDDPDTLVAIDLSWPHPEAIGYDLGQLLIGRAHSGDLPIGALPELHDKILDGFVTGLREEGCHVPVDDVRFAFDVATVLRCAFISLPLDRLDEPVTPELAAFAARRIELTRYLVDLGLAIPDHRGG